MNQSFTSTTTTRSPSVVGIIGHPSVKGTRQRSLPLTSMLTRSRSKVPVEPEPSIISDMSMLVTRRLPSSATIIMPAPDIMPPPPMPPL